MHGLDLCVLTSAHNVAYFSGLSPSGFGGPVGMVVTRTDAMTISAKSSGGRAARRGFGDRLTYDDGQRDDFWRVVAAAAGTGKAIGCEADHLTLMQSEKLNTFLQPRRGADIALAAMQQRMVKSDTELDLIRALADVADLGARALRDDVKPGMREIDIAGVGLKAMEAGIARLWPDAEYRGSSALAQSGPNSDSVASPATNRRLRRGDVIGLTATPMPGGYGAALIRFPLGPEFVVADWTQYCATMAKPGIFGHIWASNCHKSGPSQGRNPCNAGIYDVLLGKFRLVGSICCQAARPQVCP